jgi:hypothetical protein
MAVEFEMLSIQWKLNMRNFSGPDLKVLLVLEELRVDFRIKEAVFFSWTPLTRRKRLPHLYRGTASIRNRLP